MRRLEALRTRFREIPVRLGRSLEIVGVRLHAFWARLTTVLAPLSDGQVAWSTRVLALAALLLFVGSLALYSFPAFVGSIACAVAAYLLTREDVRRHPVELGVVDVRDGEREDIPAEAEAKAVYPFQVAGITLSMEKRSRWARKKA